MNIIENIVTQGHGSLNATYFCVHETANPGATALNHVNYWKNNPDYAVHYVGDWTGNVYHCVPDNRLCWQVGNGNAHVIGIELCHATTVADFQKVWDMGVDFVAYYLKKKGWGVDRLISHDDARRMWGGTDHTDPIGYFKKYGKTWNDFVNAVKAKLVAPANPTPQTKPATATLYRVQVGAFRLKTNATKLQKELQMKGFDTMIVTVDGLYKVQVGAYAVKANADKMLSTLKSQGYDTMITTNQTTTAKKTNEEIAREIITLKDFGGWGQGATRVQRLKDAGYDPDAVQAAVNALLK